MQALKVLVPKIRAGGSFYRSTSEQFIQNSKTISKLNFVRLLVTDIPAISQAYFMSVKQRTFFSVSFFLMFLPFGLFPFILTADPLQLREIFEITCF